MKYILLPIHLVRFWYLEGFLFFARTWKNSILYLEEDLAVGLMYKLLFVPLFHDSSFVGAILSFIFRVGRIVIGLFAFVLATILLITLAIYWFFVPVLILIGIYPQLNLIVLFAGMGLFLIHVFSHPHKKVWQARNDVWDASWIKKSALNYQNLLKTEEVKLLLLYLETDPSKFADFQITNVDQIGTSAFELAKKSGARYISAQAFFVASLKLTPNIDEKLLPLDLKISDFEQALNFLEKRNTQWRRVWLWDEDFSVHHLKGVNRGWLGAPTPNLDAISTDITRQVARLGTDNFIGRTKTVNEVIQVLSQDVMRNVILVGPAGSGKSTLINFLAQQIISGNAPSALATKRLVAIDLTKLLSGANSQGDVADRISAAFEEVQNLQDIIIVMEEIHNIALGEAGEKFNLYSMIAPFLDFGNFQFLATTEPQNYMRILEKNEVFARLFTKIEVLPASEIETIDILEDKAINIERTRKIRVSFLSIKKCAQLAEKYIHDRVLPDSAIAVLVQSETKSQNGWITSKIIEDTISQRVNVPVADLGTAQKTQLLDLENLIKQKFYGQEQAVKVVADTLRRGAVNLREGNRPIGSFLFVGPTGVGKTELAKVISEIYFSKKVSKVSDASEVSGVSAEKPSDTSVTFDASGTFLCFDMSEYQTPQSVDRLIGSAQNEGELTQKVAHNPYCLILLDEFEKCDPKILNLFLQILDDGRLTNFDGKTIDFTNTIIIATSNAGSLTIAQDLEQGKPWTDVEKQVHEELLTVFKPELVNRFDEIVLFKPLSQDQITSIVNLRLKDLQENLKKQGYLVEFDQNVINNLAQKGYDPVLGARPLRRLIQDTVESELSKMILQNQLHKGELFTFSKAVV